MFHMKFAPIFHEPDFLLREELRDLENYYAVLMAIATGCTNTRDMSGISSVILC